MTKASNTPLPKGLRHFLAEGHEEVLKVPEIWIDPVVCVDKNGVETVYAALPEEMIDLTLYSLTLRMPDDALMEHVKIILLEYKKALEAAPRVLMAAGTLTTATDSGARVIISWKDG